MWGHQETAGMECSRSHSEVPKLIDFFKSETRLRHQDCEMGKQNYLCSRPGNQQLWSTTSRCQGAAIADGEEREPSSAGILLVDFLGGNGDTHHHVGVDAAVLSRSSSASNVEVKHPMAKLKEAAGEHWSLQVATARPNPPTALKILSPTSTGTEESGTAAPKTPTCDMEITCRPCATIPDHYAHRDAHRDASSADSGRFGISDTVTAAQEHDSSVWHRRPEIRKLPEKERCGDDDGDVHMRSANSGTSHGRKWLKRITASRIAPPPIGLSEETPTSRPRADASAQTDPRSRRRLRPNALELEVEDADDDAEAIVQAATSLLSLSSNEGLRRPALNLSSNEGLRRPALSSSETKPEREPERGPDDDEEVGLPSCSVLSRPSNKRRYRLVVHLLAESPRVR